MLKISEWAFCLFKFSSVCAAFSQSALGCVTFLCTGSQLLVGAHQSLSPSPTGSGETAAGRLLCQRREQAEGPLPLFLLLSLSLSAFPPRDKKDAAALFKFS